MAERRMFTKKVTDDDNFMSLSSSAQALYLHLSMSADDDGFSNQVAISMFKAHASTQDLQALLEKRYIYQFENGVIVIKHWRMANALRKDRYTPTAFKEELAKLELKDNGSYTWLPNGCQSVANCLPQDRLDKNSIDKYREDKNSIGQYRVGDGEAPQPTVSEYQEYMDLWNSIPHTISINGIIPMSARDNEFRYCLHLYGHDGIVQAMQKVADSEWLRKKGDVSFDRYMNHDVIQKLLEGTYDKDFSKKEESDGYDFFG